MVRLAWSCSDVVSNMNALDRTEKQVQAEKAYRYLVHLEEK